MSKTRADAVKFLGSIVSAHVPSNARKYTYKICTDEPNVSQSFGFRFDHEPFVGKVVELNDDWIVLKTGRADFAVTDRALLSAVPDIGDSVTITPYARKKFNGRRVDEPITNNVDGFVSTTRAIGEVRSFFEVDKNTLVSPYLVDMLTQIESLPTPDGRRTLAQVFIDAGARTENIKINDPTDDELFTKPPAVTFELNSAKFQGEFSIIYDRGLDYYKISMKPTNGKVKEIEDVDFTQLAEISADLVDDGAWKLAQVAVDKPAQKRKIKM